MPDFVTRRTLPFQVRATAENGTIEGYASVYGVEDSYSDVVDPGAFSASLAKHKTNGTKPAFLWQHYRPIGVWDDMVEDKRGLYVKGRFALNVQDAKDAYELAKIGAVTGLSIGFYTVESTVNNDTAIRNISQADLVEVSLVTFPANEVARVSAVKSAASAAFDGRSLDVRAMEKLMRDAFGLSAKQAKIVIAEGWRALADPRDAASVDTARDAAGRETDVKLADALSALLNRIKS